MPVGRVTRGTTGVNRLRRVDRYLAALPQLRAVASPLVVDLGYGARPWTTLELADRLRSVAPRVRVLGLEIDPERVAEALPSAASGVDFALGGFEVPTPGGERPLLIRAMNVLRQYEEAEVPAAWTRTASRLAPDGLLVDGTCDELGRICSWVDVAPDGSPVRFTISLRLAGLESPSVVAERLPKALIHRNVPGERVHDLLAALETAWVRAAPLSVYGPVQRFTAAVDAIRAQGVPVQGGRARWRLGELTVPWSVVAPA
ncbi:class I SAM-dependent methyltransferase [Amnibacterium setariae]|uniref:Class I SAM-dependent methyltransferase n=1 Tax=Amnibacterium setariae TaxID=2306585 RepID=A0A3A1U292_9MICO|nr:class I SAM-dependent methyltransferase [Amnibacterium setariae]RIX30493.1 class I SAM-dependent methyltransferase [Amnibacterium setariae]